MAALAIFATFCIVMTIIYLVTDPKHDAAFLAWAMKKGRKPPPQFDPTLLNVDDPDYQTPTYRYLLRQLRK